MNSYKNKTQARKLTGLSYLGSVNSSAKIIKGQKLNVDTFILYLAPANLSGYEVCSKRTKGCTDACLFNSGRAKLFNRINVARTEKTKLFFENRNFFMNWLIDEITAAKKRADKRGADFAVRLNGTSDLSPLIFRHGGQNILDLFPDVQFYDYTKVIGRVKISQKYNNYHLTFSATGENNKDCLEALNAGVNVAQVFYPKLPETFLGRPVINGDETDLRYKDAPGAIVGLKFKSVKNNIDLKSSPFITLVP